MTPPPFDHREPLLPAPQAARSLREALAPSFASRPELCTPQALASLRAQLVAIVNSALTTPDYAGRFGLSPSETLIQRETTPTIQTIDLLMDDCHLGLSYIVGKNGPEGVAREIQNEGLLRTVLIGKQLRTKLVERVAGDIGERNRVTALLKRGKKKISFHLSSEVDTLLQEARPRRLRHVDEIAQWQEAVAEMETYLRFASDHSLTPQTCTSRLSSDNLDDFLLRICPAKSRFPFGLLELAVFAASFCRRHGAEPRKFFTIPAKLFPDFLRLYRYRYAGRYWMVDEGELDACRRACSGLYGDDPLAQRLMERGLRMFPNAVNTQEEAMAADGKASSIDTEDDVASQLKRIFPNPKILRDYGRETPDPLDAYDACDSDERKRGRKKRKKRDGAEENIAREAILTETFPHTVRDVVSMDDEALRSLVERYRQGIEWHPVLLGEKDPILWAKLIRKLFATNEDCCRAIAAELLLYLLSLEGPLLQGNRSPEEILAPRPSPRGALRREHPFIAAIVDALPSNIIGYCCNSLETLLIDVLKTPERGKERTVRDFVELAAQSADCPALYRLKYWHPGFREDASPLALDDAAQLLMNEYPRHLDRTVDCLIKRGIVSNHQDWADILLIISFYEEKFARWPPILLKGMPQEVVPPAFLAAAGTRLESHFSDCLWESFPDQRAQWQDTTIDFPLRIFRSPDSMTATVASPSAWEMSCAFLEELPDDVKVRMSLYIAKHPTMRFSELFPRRMEKRICSLLSASTALQQDELPLLRALCGKPGHGCLDIIADRARASPPEITARLLQMLSASDAAFLEEKLAQDEAARLASAVRRRTDPRPHRRKKAETDQG